VHLIQLVEDLSGRVDQLGADIRVLRREIHESQGAVHAPAREPRPVRGAPPTDPEGGLFDPDVEDALAEEILRRGPLLEGERGGYRNDPVIRSPYKGPEEMPGEDDDIYEERASGKRNTVDPLELVASEILSSGPVLEG